MSRHAKWTQGQVLAMMCFIPGLRWLQDCFMLRIKCGHVSKTTFKRVLSDQLAIPLKNILQPCSCGALLVQFSEDGSECKVRTGSECLKKVMAWVNRVNKSYSIITVIHSYRGPTEPKIASFFPPSVSPSCCYIIRDHFLFLVQWFLKADIDLDNHLADRAEKVFICTHYIDVNIDQSFPRLYHVSSWTNKYCFCTENVLHFWFITKKM